MKAASLLLCAVSVCSASSSPKPDEGQQTPPQAAKPETKAAGRADADGTPEAEPTDPKPPAAATGPTKPMRVRVPGAPLGELVRLAKLTECEAVPGSLPAKDRDAITQAATAYAEGRDVEAAKLVRTLAADLSPDALPGAWCHLTFQTMAAAEPALARVAKIHTYDTRRLAEIEVRLTDLRKKMTRTEPKIAVTITRWRDEPGDAGATESAEANVQLVRTELKREIEHVKAVRKLVQVRLEVAAGMLGESPDAEGLRTKLERAAKSAGGQTGTRAREVKGLLEKVAVQSPADLAADAEAAAATIAAVEAATKHAVDTNAEVKALLDDAEDKSRKCIDQASGPACVELAGVAEKIATMLSTAS